MKTKTSITVDKNGNWLQYLDATLMSAHFTPICTAVIDDYVGAIMMHTPTKKYILVNDFSDWKTHTLDQRKIKAALGISNNAGYQQKLVGGFKRCNLSLDDATIAIFQKLGNTASEGARICAQIANKSNK